MDRGKLQVKIDGEWKELVKIEEVDYKNYEWVEYKTYAKEPLRSSGEVKGTINAKFEEMFKPKCFVANDKIEKELSRKLGKVKVRKVPLSNGKSCTDFLKLWERIKENKNGET